MTTDLQTIQMLRIHFSHDSMHNCFADSLPASVIVEDSTTLSSKAGQVIRAEIVKILLDEGDTKDPRQAVILVDKCALSARFRDKRYRLRSDKQLLAALEDVCRLGGSEITIMVDCSALHFSPFYTGRELDLISDTPSFGPAPNATPNPSLAPSIPITAATNSADVFDLARCCRSLCPTYGFCPWR